MMDTKLLSVAASGEHSRSGDFSHFVLNGDKCYGEKKIARTKR